MGDLRIDQVYDILDTVDPDDYAQDQDRELAKYQLQPMTKTTAIDFMVTAIDVQDWNQKREIVKSNVLLIQRFAILCLIDARGLCSQVAKLNHWPKRR